MGCILGAGIPECAPTEEGPIAKTNCARGSSTKNCPSEVESVWPHTSCGFCRGPRARLGRVPRTSRSWIQKPFWEGRPMYTPKPVFPITTCGPLARATGSARQSRCNIVRPILCADSVGAISLCAGALLGAHSENGLAWAASRFGSIPKNGSIQPGDRFDQFPNRAHKEPQSSVFGARGLAGRCFPHKTQRFCSQVYWGSSGVLC